MARVLSTSVTAKESNGQIDTPEAPGELREIAGVVSPAADQADTDTLHFFRLPSNAIISQVLLTAAVATTAGAINIGVYETEENGGAAVDADLFASALDLSAAANSNADVTYESGEFTPAESETRLWEILGLSSDPGKEYDVVADISTTFNGGPTSIRLAARFRQ